MAGYFCAPSATDPNPDARAGGGVGRHHRDRAVDRIHNHGIPPCAAWMPIAYISGWFLATLKGVPLSSPSGFAFDGVLQLVESCNLALFPLNQFAALGASELTNLPSTTVVDHLQREQLIFASSCGTNHFCSPLICL